MKNGKITVEQQIAYMPGGAALDSPKNDHSRTVTVLTPALEALKEHFRDRPAIGATPLFTNAAGKRLSRTSLYREWYKVRDDTGLPWLHIHDLRHTGLTVFAQGNSTLKELMDRAGHSTPAIAMRYQHTAAGREEEVTSRASEVMQRRRA